MHVFSKFILDLKIRLSLLLRKLGIYSANSIYYIGGADTLPPPLTAEEENYLLKKIDDKNLGVRSILIEHNLRLVVYIARKFETHLFV